MRCAVKVFPVLERRWTQVPTDLPKQPYSSKTATSLTVTVTNLSQASLGRPSPRALKPRLRYKLNHGVVGGVYYNLYTRGARPGRVVCLRCSCEYVGWALARLAPPSGRAASRAWSRVARRVGGR